MDSKSNSTETNAAKRLDSIEEEPIEDDKTKAKPKVPPKPKMIQPMIPPKPKVIQPMVPPKPKLIEAPNGRLKPVPPPRPTKT